MLKLCKKKFQALTRFLREGDGEFDPSAVAQERKKWEEQERNELLAKAQRQLSKIEEQKLRDRERGMLLKERERRCHFVKSVRNLLVKEQYDEVESVLSEAIQEFPKDLWFNDQFVKTAAGRGDLEEARSRNDALIKKFSKSEELLILYCENLVELQGCDDADEIVEKFVERFPQSERLALLFSSTANENGDTEKAIERVLDGIGRIPKSYKLRLFHGDLLCYIEEYDKALEVYESCSSLGKEECSHLVKICQISHSSLSLNTVYPDVETDWEDRVLAISGKLKEIPAYRKYGIKHLSLRRGSAVQDGLFNLLSNGRKRPSYGTFKCCVVTGLPFAGRGFFINQIQKSSGVTDRIVTFDDSCPYSLSAIDYPDNYIFTGEYYYPPFEASMLEGESLLSYVDVNGVDSVKKVVVVRHPLEILVIQWVYFSHLQGGDWASLGSSIKELLDSEIESFVEFASISIPKVLGFHSFVNQTERFVTDPDYLVIRFEDMYENLDSIFDSFLDHIEFDGDQNIIERGLVQAPDRTVCRYEDLLELEGFRKFVNDLDDNLKEKIMSSGYDI